MKAEIPSLEQSQALIDKLRASYEANPDSFIFALSTRLSGKELKAVRIQIMLMLTGEERTASQCKIKHLEAELLKSFNQLTLF